jgi:exonuclease III
MDPHDLYPEETKPNEKCPAPTSLLCGSRTLARGLCVAHEKDCALRTLEKRPILDQAVNEKGAAHFYSGYTTENLGRGCYFKPDELRKDYDEEYAEFDNIPNIFSLMTYNMWGLAKNNDLKQLFQLRKDILLDTLISANSDCMCLQEMSKYAYGELKDYIALFPFASEIPYPKGGARDRNADTYYISKYRPKRVIMYAVRGVLDYDNCFMVIEYPNLIIFNLYSQAGSVSSVGQEKVWIHYARCRYDIMDIIHDMIQSTPSYKHNNVVITGDFNFHLDGSERDWPESAMLKKLNKIGFIDTYRAKNDGPGYTENTDENFMRWNHKLMEKKYRFDAILFRPTGNSWKVYSSKVFGKKLKHLSHSDSEWFVKTITSSKDWEKMRGVKDNSKGRRIAINASDHFGVRTVFAKSSQTRRRRRGSSSRMTRSA